MLHKIALSLIPGIGNVLARNLIAYVGSVEAIFKEKKSNLVKIPGIGEILAESILKANVLQRAEKELLFIDKYKIDVFFYLDKDYPERLKNMNDAPLLFYSKGKINYNNKKAISIIGTRKATAYGKNMCERLIKEMAERNHKALIVSGLAYGIDIHAHKYALENKLPTVAVLGNGLDSIYPKEHTQIAKEMLANGGLLSEFISETKLFPQNFVKRNRIIAGLTDATLVIESALKGGSLITAQLANSYHRDVFAVPGKLTDKYSEGCNHLIKTNQAVLIEKVADLEYILGWEQKKIEQKKLFFTFSTEEQKIFDFLQSAGTGVFIDEISYKTEIPIQNLLSSLLNMEFMGAVKSLPGKVFQIA